MTRTVVVLGCALALGAWVLIGCTAPSGSAASADPAPINTGTLGGGGGQTDGGNDADDGGVGDTSTNGTDGVDTNGIDDADSNGINDNEDTEPVGTPVVTLAIGDVAPSVSETIFLTCVVTDSGGSPATQFEFVSTAGGGEIVQDGGNIASALIPPGLFSINYQCRAVNAAGTGPFSPIVIVNIGS